MAPASKIKRALQALPAYAEAAAWALLLAGVTAFALLPLAAKRCYLDEKALLVGGSLPTVRSASCSRARRRRQWRRRKAGRARSLPEHSGGPTAPPLPITPLSCLVHRCRQSGALEACVASVPRLQDDATSAGGNSGDSQHAFARVARAAAAAAGLELHQHNFTSSTRAGRQCSTLHTVVRALRGDGAEGFVLALPLDAAAAPRAAALAAAAGAALAGHLRRSGWLAKDAVLLFLDAGCGSQAGAQVGRRCRGGPAWRARWVVPPRRTPASLHLLGGSPVSCTHSRHHPPTHTPALPQAWVAAHNSGADLFAFPRAGLLQQALVLEVAGGAAGPSGSPGAAELSVHGVGGQLPNLDLYYLLKRNVDLHTGLPVSLRSSAAPLPPALQRGAAGLGAAAAALGLAPAEAAQGYAAELQTLAAFSAQLASWSGSGAHAAFLAHQVDAATLTLRLAAAAEASPGGTGGAAQAQLQAGAYATLAAAEMCLRTFSNLQERLHHSTALYVLVSPDRFASIATYLAPPACLLAAALAQVCEGRAVLWSSWGERGLLCVCRAVGLLFQWAWSSVCRFCARPHSPAQLAAAVRRSHGAPAAAWQTAWQRVALAHVGGWAAVAIAATLRGWQPGSSELSALASQLLWVAAAGIAAATGPPALLQAVKPDASGCGDSTEIAAPQAQACTAAAGLAAVVLHGCALLLGQWVRAATFLLAAVPLYALSLGLRPSKRAALAARVLGCCAAWALPRALAHAGTPWLAAPLLAHLLAACLSLQ